MLYLACFVFGVLVGWATTVALCLVWPDLEEKNNTNSATIR
jgi:hypothetical protein